MMENRLEGGNLRYMVYAATQLEWVKKWSGNRYREEKVNK